mmetsp:Transcript_96048/g.200651  ORF Transcript_96048/g.200651 Transcript_96048/m.200651 type:complete len:206 (+) Transcript_96048:1392-2009(+)
MRPDLLSSDLVLFSSQPEAAWKDISIGGSFQTVRFVDGHVHELPIVCEGLHDIARVVHETVTAAIDLFRSMAKPSPCCSVENTCCSHILVVLHHMLGHAVVHLRGSAEVLAQCHGPWVRVEVHVRPGHRVFLRDHELVAVAIVAKQVAAIKWSQQKKTLQPLDILLVQFFLHIVCGFFVRAKAKPVGLRHVSQSGASQHFYCSVL